MLVHSGTVNTDFDFPLFRKFNIGDDIYLGGLGVDGLLVEAESPGDIPSGLPLQGAAANGYERLYGHCAVPHDSLRTFQDSVGMIPREWSVYGDPESPYLVRL